MATSYTFEIQDIKVYISLIEKKRKKGGVQGEKNTLAGKEIIRNMTKANGDPCDIYLYTYMHVLSYSSCCRLLIRTTISQCLSLQEGRKSDSQCWQFVQYQISERQSCGWSLPQLGQLQLLSLRLPRPAI